MLLINEICLLVSELSDQDIDVQFGENQSQVLWNGLNTPARVYILESAQREHMLYDLLHEMAHIELRKDWAEYREKYPATCLADEKWLAGINKYKRRKQYAVEVIEEEFEAWRIGLEIAQSYSIKVDKLKYSKYASNSVALYLRKFKK